MADEGWNRAARVPRPAPHCSIAGVVGPDTPASSAPRHVNARRLCYKPPFRRPSHATRRSLSAEKPLPRRRRLGRRRDRRDPQSGDRRHDRQGPPLRRGGGEPRHRSGAEGLRAVGEDAAEAARGNLAPMVRSDHRQSRRYRPHHDQRAGQAPRRSARRGRLRRGLHRVLRRGGQAHLRRDQPDLPRRIRAFSSSGNRSASSRRSPPGTFPPR